MRWIQCKKKTAKHFLDRVLLWDGLVSGRALVNERGVMNPTAEPLAEVETGHRPSMSCSWSTRLKAAQVMICDKNKGNSYSVLGISM